jgi:hypothetical protein
MSAFFASPGGLVEQGSFGRIEGHVKTSALRHSAEMADQPWIGDGRRQKATVAYLCV